MDGSRIVMTLGREVSTKGSTFTIRRFRDEPFTPVDLLEFKTFSSMQIAFFWLAMQYGMSMLFVGGTASGKDSGAAIGALGGAIVANESAKGAKVTGYRLERQCNDVTVYQNTNIEVYSHSTIRFYIDGKRYVVPFQK